MNHSDHTGRSLDLPADRAALRSLLIEADHYIRKVRDYLARLRPHLRPDSIQVDHRIWTDSKMATLAQLAYEAGDLGLPSRLRRLIELPGDPRLPLESLGVAHDRASELIGPADRPPEVHDRALGFAVLEEAVFAVEDLRDCITAKLDVQARSNDAIRPDTNVYPIDGASVSEVRPRGTEPTLRSRKRKRNQGKSDQCVGIYVAYLDRGECPPGPAAIAAEVGCSPGTASRAIKRWDDKRKELAQDDARERYRDHG